MTTRYYRPLPEEEKKAMTRAAGTAKLLALPADIAGKSLNPKNWDSKFAPGRGEGRAAFAQSSRNLDAMMARDAEKVKNRGNVGVFTGNPQTKAPFTTPWKRATGVPETNVEKERASDSLTAGSEQHRLEVENIENSLLSDNSEEVKSNINLQEQHDGVSISDEERLRLTAEDQALASGKIERETTFGPEGVESIKINEGPGEPTDPPKAEVKDGPFSSTANTFNTVNSMIKGLSAILANRNPDAQNVAFADPTDYFKDKKALEDWRKRMYRSQVG